MAKIPSLCNDKVAEKINAIAVQRRAEGAKEKDISYSSIASMLLALVYVYEASPDGTQRIRGLIRWHSIERCLKAWLKHSLL